MEKERKIKIFLNLMRSLSDGQRVKILKLLHERIMCVSEIQAVSGLKQPAVSKQLIILRNAKLVHTHKRGLNVYYYVANCEYTPHDFLDILREIKAKGLFDEPDFRNSFNNWRKGEGYVDPRVQARTRRLERELSRDHPDFLLWLDYFFNENEETRYISQFLRYLRKYFDPDYIGLLPRRKVTQPQKDSSMEQSQPKQTQQEQLVPKAECEKGN